MTTSGPAFLVDSQSALLTSVLDRIIPPDGALPGAGQLGVADHIDRVLGSSAGFRMLFTSGLAHIEITSHKRHAQGFAGLSAADKDGILRDVESSEADFFADLVRHAYNGYYTDRKVVELRGLEARPPQPTGYSVETGNLGLIENVKKRGQVYRDA